jgi:hypothetical protein
MENSVGKGFALGKMPPSLSCLSMPENIDHSKFISSS